MLNYTNMQIDFITYELYFIYRLSKMIYLLF